MRSTATRFQGTGSPHSSLHEGVHRAHQALASLRLAGNAAGDAGSRTHLVNRQNPNIHVGHFRTPAGTPIRSKHGSTAPQRRSAVTVAPPCQPNKRRAKPPPPTLTPQCSWPRKFGSLEKTRVWRFRVCWYMYSVLRDTQNGRVLEQISVCTNIMARIHWVNSQV